MKKLLVLLVGLCLALTLGAGETKLLGDLEVPNPNLEASVFYDLTEGKFLGGATSEILAWKCFELRFGYVSNDYCKWLICPSLNFDKLTELGLKVGSWFKDNKISIGYWIGYDFEQKRWGNGLMGVALRIEF